MWSRTALLSLCAVVEALPRGWAAKVLDQRIPAVSPNAAMRFSIYPKTTGSLRATIKRAVSGVDGLGLDMQADDVSSLLSGPRETIFEAMEGVLGRAASVEGEPHVSMQCTISTDVPLMELPERAADADEWFVPPPRVACQFAIYSLGADEYGCYGAVLDLAAQSSCIVSEHGLCLMLEGDGSDVFCTLQECFELACTRSLSGHVVMTATITANKAAWKSNEKAGITKARASDDSSDDAIVADPIGVTIGDSGVAFQAGVAAEALRSLLKTHRTIGEPETQEQLPADWEATLDQAMDVVDALSRTGRR